MIKVRFENTASSTYFYRNSLGTDSCAVGGVSVPDEKYECVVGGLLGVGFSIE